VKAFLVRVLPPNRPNVAENFDATPERLAYIQQDGCHVGGRKMFLNLAI
jgi:hypothetical protein